MSNGQRFLQLVQTRAYAAHRGRHLIYIPTAPEIKVLCSPPFEQGHYMADLLERAFSLVVDQPVRITIAGLYHYPNDWDAYTAQYVVGAGAPENCHSHTRSPIFFPPPDAPRAHDWEEDVERAGKGMRLVELSRSRLFALDIIEYVTGFNPILEKVRITLPGPTLRQTSRTRVLSVRIDLDPGLQGLMGAV